MKKEVGDALLNYLDTLHEEVDWLGKTVESLQRQVGSSSSEEDTSLYWLKRGREEAFEALQEAQRQARSEAQADRYVRWECEVGCPVSILRVGRASGEKKTHPKCSYCGGSMRVAFDSVVIEKNHEG